MSRPPRRSGSLSLVPLLLVAVVSAVFGTPLRGQSTESAKRWLRRVALLTTAEERKTFMALANAKAEAEFMKEFWKKHPWPQPTTSPEESERLFMKRVEYAEDAFGKEPIRENEKPWNFRTFLFVFFNPPEKRYKGEVEVGAEPLQIRGVQEFHNHLLNRTQGARGSGAPGGVSLSAGDSDISSLFGAEPGAAPAAGAKVAGEKWIFPSDTPGRVRVFTFADLNGDGIYYPVGDEEMAESDAPAIGLPETYGSEFFEKEPERVWKTLPIPAGDPIEPKSRALYSRRENGRTEVNVIASVSKRQLEAAGLDPVAWMNSARFFLGVTSPAGAWVEQVETKFVEEGEVAGDLFRGRLRLALDPGSWKATLVLTGDSNRGGVRELTLEAPDFRTRPELSDVILVRVPEGPDGQPDLKALRSDSPKPATDQPAGFTMGPYRVSPLFGETAILKGGEWLGVYVRLFNDPAGVVTFTLQDGTGEELGKIGEGKVSTENGGHLWAVTRVVPGADGWPPGDYAIGVKSTDSKTNTILTRTARFKVK